MVGMLNNKKVPLIIIIIIIIIKIRNIIVTVVTCIQTHQTLHSPTK